MFAVSLTALLAATGLIGQMQQTDGNWHSVIQIRNGTIQPAVTGSGRIIRQGRPTRNFSSIQLDGMADLEVRTGARASIEVEADDNLMPHFTSEAEGGVLRLGTRGYFRTRHRPVIRVTVPDLESVHANGSGGVRIEGVNSDRLELVSQGSGRFVVQGRAQRVAASFYGSGGADLDRLVPSNLAVSVYGSGNVRVHSAGELVAAIYGSGRIAYRGRPSRLEVSVHGSGRVEQVR